MQWNRAPKPRKWRVGPRVESAETMIFAILDGKPLYVRGKWMHSAVLLNWSLAQIRGAVWGDVRFAEPNPEYTVQSEDTPI
jgi:hypothetical protein